MSIIKKIFIKVRLIILDNFIYYLRSIKYKFLSLFNNKKGINIGEERENKIIVSITSIPSRFTSLYLCLETIMRQSLKPDKIILYLGNNTKNMELPQNFKKMKKRGLTIEYRDDKELKPHTKYFYAMQEHPNDIIITFDDDILYNKNVIKMLYESYLKFPNEVSAIRVHKITFNQDKINKYKNWIMEYKGKDTLIPSHYLCATGVGGVLYPPHIMPKETFNKENIKNLSLSADDLWLKVMQIKYKIKVVKALEKNYYLFVIKNSQSIALNKTNVDKCENDRVLSNLLNYYGINKKDFD